MFEPETWGFWYLKGTRYSVNISSHFASFQVDGDEEKFEEIFEKKLAAQREESSKKDMQQHEQYINFLETLEELTQNGKIRQNHVFFHPALK